MLLAVADDKLLLGHRNSDWTGLGPILEEDIAFSSLAQDEIAHAQALYEVVGHLVGQTADDLAFGRTPEQYRCAAIVEIPDDFDWATALCRQFFCDHFDALRLARLAQSTDTQIAHLSKRLLAEERIHVEHVDEWIQRLGRSTKEARERLQSALDALTPVAETLIEPTAGQALLEEAGLYPSRGDMFQQWAQQLGAVAQASTLKLELGHNADQNGGRCGHHTKHLAPLLQEMGEVYRIEPGAAW